MRIAIISDTHLSRSEPRVVANNVAVANWIHALRADHVVHLGDIVANGIQEPADYAFAHETFAVPSSRMAWLPGNHDIGEDAITAAQTGDPIVAQAALAAWRASFGADYWALRAAGWTLLGIDAQLLGMEDDAGEAQASWLDEQLQNCNDKMGVLLHKPLFRDSAVDADTHRRYVPLKPRRKLWQQLIRKELRFVVSGHTHQWRQYWTEDVEHVWAPSVAYTFPDHLQETIGRKVLGALVLELSVHGHQFAFVEVDGVVPLEYTPHE